MTALAVQIIVLAKAPVPGRVKTRLSPTFSPEQAAMLATAALVDTLRAVGATDVQRRVLALDGSPGPWAPGDAFEIVRQRGDRLDQRIANAFDDTWAGAGLPMMLVGMDTPQICPSVLTAAVRELLDPDADAVLGLAEDGGFWAIGLREPCPDLVVGVEMSTDRTGSDQLARLRAAGQQTRVLPLLRDVDTAADAEAVSAAAPNTSFAATWSDLVAEHGHGGPRRSREGAQ